MFLFYKTFLPFFNSEGGASGNTDDSKPADKPGEQDNTGNETDDVLAGIEKDLNESRAKVFAEDDLDEGITADNKPDDQKPPAPKEPEGVVTLDDNFIKGAENLEMFKKLDKEKVSVILNKIKGSQVDAKILKNYVHGQVKLEEYNRTKDASVLEDEENSDKFESFADRTEEDYANNLEQLDDKERQQIDQAKRSAIYNMLKPKYKDLTLEDLNDDDAVNSYLANLQVNKPLQADDFKADFRNAGKRIDKEANEYLDRSLNYGDYMRRDAKEMVDKFNTMLQSKGIDPKQLEVELDEKWIVQNIVKNKDGKLNTDMISYYKNKVPTLNKTSFYQALVDKFDERITELTKKAGINEYITGKRKKDANPSISNSGAGARTKIESTPEHIPTDEFPGFDAIDKALAASRKKIFEKGESVYPDA